MSMNTEIYQDISTRTAGDIYIGVVGPVRAGKSTFIKRFMETQVIPNIDNVYRRERAKDELPQSGSGRKKHARSKAAESAAVLHRCIHIRLLNGNLTAAVRGARGDSPLRSLGVPKGRFSAAENHPFDRNRT